MARIVFMGTPQFAVPTLRSLIATQTVVGVVTQPDRPAGRGRQIRPSPVKVVAQEAGIPLHQPKSLRTEAAAAPLRTWQPEMIVVAAFGQILRSHVLTLPPLGCVNVHASLLPRWRGASPIQYAILSGDDETGITLMKMDEGLDTGPIYVQEAIPITLQETAASLHDKLAELGAAMVKKHLDDVINGRLQPTPQDDSHATYAPTIKKEDGQLDWTDAAAALERRIRAMTPWPGAYTRWQGQRLKIVAARPVASPLPSDTPGTVVEWGETAVVLTGDGGLALKEVQLAGKRAMSTDDFLRGRPDFIGAELEA